ncbi:hypothetical protein [Cupriavidus basilensis]|uniref:hypothetical protein n=1 Tax=Cupriavidus basilensis TaxID=68895 RepID=UPI0039F64B15
MNKLIAALVAGLFATGVFAQAAAPAPAAPAAAAPAAEAPAAKPATKSTKKSKKHAHSKTKAAPVAKADAAATK